MRTRLTKAFARAGPDSGALVYDLTAKQTLFALRPAAGRPPASVEKLYTTVALLGELGPDARLETTVVGDGHLGPGGVWHGNLHLVGGGDPTLGDGSFNRTWEQGFGPTANELVRQLIHDRIRRVTGWVIGDAALFDELRGGPATAYGPDIPDFGGQLAGLTYDHGSTFRHLNPGAFAAKELALTMHGAHIGARPLNRTLPAPAGTVHLASVESPPLSVMLNLMDVRSDDFFAEMLTKQLGARFGGGGSIQAGARVISQMIDSFGAAPDDRRWLGAVALGRLLSRAGRGAAADRVEHADRARAGGCAARCRGERHGAADRRPHRRTGSLHRQDRNAQLRDEPGRVLHGTQPPHARVRPDDRRAGQLERVRAPRSDGPGHHSLLIRRASPGTIVGAVEVTTAVNRRELQRYLVRVGDRWPIDAALLGGARVADERGAAPQRERGPEFIVILVSSAFEGMPWLERVYHAGSLWDGLEMGAGADVHCYTPGEFERKRATLPQVIRTVEDGIDLMAEASA